LREDASLLVMLVTDEADCSSRPEAASIFATDGDKTFWSDPDSSFPSSALCWNAGVECSGEPSSYDDCVAADKDLLGQSSAPDDAVLYPVDRYKNLLAEIEQAKRALAPDAGLDVAMLAITGVGLDNGFNYADSPDPSFQADFGIGPGCESAGLSDLRALPPVRIREVAEHISVAPFASICADDYSGFMQGVVEQFAGGC
jgi:hypothetical protein